MLRGVGVVHYQHYINTTLWQRVYAQLEQMAAQCARAQQKLVTQIQTWETQLTTVTQASQVRSGRELGYDNCLTA